MRSALLVAILYLSCGTLAGFSQEREIVDGFIVDVIDLDLKVVEVIGTYLDYNEAVKAQVRWDEGNKKLSLESRMREGKVEVTRRKQNKSGRSEPEVQNNGPNGGTIKAPDLKWVDIPEANTNGKEFQSLSGKKGKGKIGQYNAAISFAKGDGKGEYTVDGEIKGKGRWVQLGPYVQMESETSKYEGKIEGSRIVGSRTIKESGTKEDWFFDLNAELAGRRGRGTFMDGVTPFSVEFRTGGVGLFKSADEAFTGTWSVDGDSITMKAGASIFTGKIKGSQISGRVYRNDASSVVTGGRLSDRGGPWDLTLQP